MIGDDQNHQNVLKLYLNVRYWNFIEIVRVERKLCKIEMDQIGEDNSH